MCERFYAVHEEIFVLLFKPAIYRMDDLFVTIKFLSAKWIFQRSENMIAVFQLAPQDPGGNRISLNSGPGSTSASRSLYTVSLTLSVLFEVPEPWTQFRVFWYRCHCCAIAFWCRLADHDTVTTNSNVFRKITSCLYDNSSFIFWWDPRTRSALLWTFFFFTLRHQSALRLLICPLATPLCISSCYIRICSMFRRVCKWWGKLYRNSWESLMTQLHLTVVWHCSVKYSLNPRRNLSPALGGESSAWKWPVSSGPLTMESYVLSNWTPCVNSKLSIS